MQTDSPRSDSNFRESAEEPSLSTAVARSPYVAVGTALAIGFVLGGGLTPSILRHGIGLGARAAVLALAKDAVSGAGEVAVDATS